MQNNNRWGAFIRLQDLRAFAPAIFFIATLVVPLSCRKPENVIGLGVQPPADQIDALTLMVDVETSTAPADSIRSDQTSLNLAGSYTDPLFGQVTASFYTQIRLLSTGLDFGPQTQLDSLVLTLRYRSNYGNASTPQTFQVFELNESIFRDSVYFSDAEIGRFPNPVGNTTFAPKNITDSVQIGGVTVPPHLRIRLDDALGQRFLNASGTPDLANNENFLNFFKGLYVQPVNNHSPGNGGIVSFDLLSPFSNLTLYYSRTDTPVSLSHNFVINENSARINAHSFNYSGTEVAAAIANPQLGNIKTYVQGLGGVRTRIQLPDIPGLFGDEVIVINQAELIIPVEENFGVHIPPERLNVVAHDEEGRALLLPDFAEGFGYFGGGYSSATNEYRFNIARYLQNLLRGVPDHGLTLLPIGGAVNPNRVVLKGGGAPERKMRIRIIYTKI